MKQTNREFLENIVDLMNSPTNHCEAEREMREFCGLANVHHCGECGLTPNSWNFNTGCPDCGANSPNTIVKLQDDCRGLNP